MERVRQGRAVHAEVFLAGFQPGAVTGPAIEFHEPRRVAPRCRFCPVLQQFGVVDNEEVALVRPLGGWFFQTVEVSPPVLLVLATVIPDACGDDADSSGIGSGSLVLGQSGEVVE
ncbi:hypothetical protein D3C73_1098970 [compost metagenome]